MTLSRRGFIASAVVAGATASVSPSAVAAIPAPPFASPPPGMFVPDVVGHKLLRVVRHPAVVTETPLSPFEIAQYYTEAKKGEIAVQIAPLPRTPQLSFECSAFRTEELQEFDSFRDLLLAAFDVRHRDISECFILPDGTRIGEPYVDTKIQINRLANMVAARSRRGSGHTVFYSGPDNAFGFDAADHRAWYERPGYHYSWNVYETPALNPDEIVVLYHRTNSGTMLKKEIIDGPFVAQMLPGGRVRAILREDSRNYGFILRAVA